jgi:hypothetical protein
MLSEPECERLLFAAIIRHSTPPESPCGNDSSLTRLGEATRTTLVLRSSRLKSAALVQLDHIAIGIAQEDPLRPGPEAHGTATQRDPGRL